jgi:glycosyltransferase involved in cell wall biosynthesis
MDFVFLSTQGWDEMGGAGRPIHYFARELLARGDRVLYVQVVPHPKTVAQTNLTVVDFGALGFDETALRRAWCGLDPRVDFQNAFARALDAFQAPDAERVVVYADPFVPFVALYPLFRARHYKIVYDALDDFAAFPEIGLYFANLDAEKFLVAHSDLVIAVSTTLAQKLSAWTHRAPVQLLRQGFDAAAFRPPPSPPARASGQITLGFWGQVNAFNVDTALLEYVARARPQWTFQLIGPLDLDPALPRVEPALRALPNAQLLGPVAHADLNKHLQNFDVALVPFPANAFNRARDPLKVLEYLAGYKPVVAAHTPQLAGMPYVFLADTPEEFLAAIEHALTIRVDRAQVDAYLAECAWGKRVDQLLTWLAETKTAAETPTPAVAQWYADAALNANAREYIARTEQLLDERTRYLRALEHDAQAKQAHIQHLQQTNPFWKIKGFFGH